MSGVVYQAPMIGREDYRKYRGRHVALYEGKIVDGGSSPVEALGERFEESSQVEACRKSF